MAEASVVKPIEDVWPTVVGLLSSVANQQDLELDVIIEGITVFRAPVDTPWATPPRGSGGFAWDSPSIDQEREHYPVSSFSIGIPLVGAMQLSFADPRASSLSKGKIEHVRATVDACAIILDQAVATQVRATNLAHEMTILLQATSGIVADFLEEIEDYAAEGIIGGDLIDDARLIEAENSLMLNVLRNYLSLMNRTKFDDTAGNLRRERIEVGPLTEHLIGVHSRTLRGREVAIKNDLPEELPSIHAEQQEVARAIHNCISNAMKYSFGSIEAVSPRHVRVYARVPYDPRTGSWAICIENYGVGLDRDEIRHAFQPGFRGRAAQRQTALGSGIGLSEVQRIMNRLGGRARITSKFLHEGPTGDVYLTTSSLVFPGGGRRS